MLELSVYIHWPFCEKKCPYCDFNSHVRASIDEQNWHKAYMNAIDLNFSQNVFSLYEKVNVKTVFFGGGTPSLMNPSLVAAILEKINSYSGSNIFSNAEITLEANPSSVENAKLKSFAEVGVNRVSMGVQSLRDENLKFLGRKHSSKQAIDAIDIIRKYFTNYSIDLIYAFNNQTEDDLKQELKQILPVIDKHISLYQLTIEKGTDFYKDYKKGTLKEINNEKAFKLMQIANSFLEEKGFINYEVSNFAKKGFESIHNLNYWQFGSYLGIGAGSHSRINADKNRYSFFEYSQPEKWLSLALNNQSPIQEKRLMNEGEIKNELLLFGLRTKYGINNFQTMQFLGKNIHEVFDARKLQKLEQEGLIISLQEKLILTKSGRMLLNSVVRYLS
jgi:putative oxygen-independent coproporphyrinogen III oxidase